MKKINIAAAFVFSVIYAHSARGANTCPIPRGMVHQDGYDYIKNVVDNVSREPNFPDRIQKGEIASVERELLSDKKIRDIFDARSLILSSLCDRVVMDRAYSKNAKEAFIAQASQYRKLIDRDMILQDLLQEFGFHNKFESTFGYILQNLGEPNKKTTDHSLYHTEDLDAEVLYSEAQPVSVSFSGVTGVALTSSNAVPITLNKQTIILSVTTLKDFRTALFDCIPKYISSADVESAPDNLICVGEYNNKSKKINYRIKLSLNYHQNNNILKYLYLLNNYSIEIGRNLKQDFYKTELLTPGQVNSIEKENFLSDKSIYIKYKFLKEYIKKDLCSECTINKLEITRK